MRRTFTLALLAAAALTGCGDDEPSTTSSSTTTESSTTTSTTTTSTSTSTAPAPPGETPEDAARAVLTVDGTAEEACETNVTTAFVAVSYGSRKNCIAAHTPDALAQSIEVVSSKKTSIGVHLVVVPDGGPYDGAKVEVEVIGVEDAYRVDSLQAHVPAGP